MILIYIGILVHMTAMFFIGAALDERLERIEKEITKNLKK